MAIYVAGEFGFVCQFLDTHLKNTGLCRTGHRGQRRIHGLSACTRYGQLHRGFAGFQLGSLFFTGFCTRHSAACFFIRLKKAFYVVV